MERLFTIIGRINSLLFLLILLGAGISMAWGMARSAQWAHRDAIEVTQAESGDSRTVSLQFGRAERVAGSSTVMTALRTTGTGKVFSGSGSGSSTRNFLFVTGAERNARWLFEHHQNNVLDSSQIGEGSSCSDKHPATALYFEYVATDTDGDGRLSSTDRLTVALTRPDGSGLSTALQDVDSVLSHEMLDGEHLSIVYRKGAVVRHAKFAIANLQLITDEEIASVADAAH